MDDEQREWDVTEFLSGGVDEVDVEDMFVDEVNEDDLFVDEVNEQDMFVDEVNEEYMFVDEVNEEDIFVDEIAGGCRVLSGFIVVIPAVDAGTS